MSTVSLRPPTLEECQQVRVWRNAPDVLPMLRTKEPLTEEQQASFYRDVVRNLDADHRYYAIECNGVFVGLGGLTYLSRQPGEAEISLILGPEFRGHGIGTEAVSRLLDQAWALGLTSVIGECYATGNLNFWVKRILERQATVRWTWRKP
jgi:RimJ/RimL family protein N-acetyltransferase